MRVQFTEIRKDIREQGHNDTRVREDEKHGAASYTRPGVMDDSPSVAILPYAPANAHRCLIPWRNQTLTFEEQIQFALLEEAGLKVR